MKKTYENENTIMTVNGPIWSKDLGFCHSHEHLFIAKGKSAEINPSLCIDNFEKTVKELRLFKKVGGESIVDAQPIGCGRMANLQYKASAVSGINIISSTGFHKLEFYKNGHWINKLSMDDLSEVFISEYEKGMYLDGDDEYPSRRIWAKPGVIKVASDENRIRSSYIKLFNAAAVASIETGLPILGHTEMGIAGLAQAEFFLIRGIPASSIVICHMDRKLNDYSYTKAVLNTGVYLEFDTIGRFKYHSDEDEAKLILKLVEDGYEDQILIGLDTTRERFKSYNGVIGLDYIKESFIPLLKKYGLSQSIIDKFVISNPSRAFSNHKAKCVSIDKKVRSI